MSTYPTQVRIIEVGPRDGLQNEPQSIDVHDKVQLIHTLAQAGLNDIEIGSFVSAQWVPQMADTAAVLTASQKAIGNSVTLWSLTPNRRGLDDAIQNGAKAVAVFTAASESFNQRNINVSIEQSLSHIADICHKAKPLGLKIRGYISCALGCPYEGSVSEITVAKIAKKLMDLGCDEISLGDTVGVGTPLHAQKLIQNVTKVIPIDRLAIHFHDTYGQALANILACLELGMACIDSAISGLGGCPYAPGASGNVATEDVVYMLEGMGIQTGIKMDSLLVCSSLVQRLLSHPVRSKTAQALLAQQGRRS